MGLNGNAKVFHAARRHRITIWWSRQPFLGASSRTISIPQTKQLSQAASAARKQCRKQCQILQVPTPHISSYLLTMSHRNPALLEPGSHACFQTGSAPWCCPCLRSKTCTNLSIKSHMQSMQIPSWVVPFQNHHQQLDSWNKYEQMVPSTTAAPCAVFWKSMISNRNDCLKFYGCRDGFGACQAEPNSEKHVEKVYDVHWCVEGHALPCYSFS